MKRIIAALLTLIMLTPAAFAAAPEVPAPSVILMERDSGTVLAEKNADEQLPPASVTKVMTLLLIMEALDAGIISESDEVTVSNHAASMGGSQIWLEPGEKMSVRDMLKAIVVVSANDASVAMGELLAGSEDAFVDRMNERAGELGMTNTSFKNCTGLPADGHLTTARDIAIMSCELLKHEGIKKYTTIWMDTLRNGESSLVNTNRLIRFYNGATGLKTGSTDAAKYCLSGSAERNGMELVCAILAADTSDQRFAAAQTMLDYGFANYAAVNVQPDNVLLPVAVRLGKSPEVAVRLASNDKIVVDKARAGNIVREVLLPEETEAPVAAGQRLGELVVSSDGEELARVPILACDDVERLSFWDVMGRLMGSLLMK